MRRYYLASATGVLILAMLACNLPFAGQNSQADRQQATIEAIAQQTLSAAEATATASGLGQAVETAQAQAATSQAQSVAVNATAVVQATQQAAAINATAQAQAALATSQSAAATSQALSAQSTALWLNSTATALAFPTQLPPAPSFPQPQPPPQHPQPQPPPASNMTRLRFSQGATSITVDGAVAANHTNEYVIKAMANQWMLADIFSNPNNVYLGVLGLSDGIPLLRTIAGSTTFNGKLPATQDYRISVASPYQNSNYTLQVIIPARIQFAPGAFSKNIQGALPAHGTNYYTAGARGGQTMNVTIISPHNDVLLTIYGMTDGQPLIRYQSGAYSFVGVLPATQDYMIEAVATGGSTNYTIAVIIQ
jgi:hypothetical protein